MSFHWEINHGFDVHYSDKHDKCFKPEKLKKWLNELDPQKKWCIAKQNHSSIIISHQQLNHFKNFDGLVCDDINNGLVVFGSDCPGLIVVTKDLKFAAAHCGWRGTVSGIVRNAVEALTKVSSSSKNEWTAFIGPGISVEHFEVGEDVFKLPIWKREAIKPISNKKAYLNLPLSIELQLNELGVMNVIQSSICTYAHEDLHSYRRDQFYANQVLSVYFKG